MPITARELAYDLLSHADERKEFVTDRLEQRLAAEGLSGPDRGLAVELVHGVIQRQATLDVLIHACSKRGRANIEPDLWTLLRLGAYQLAFLDGIPPHAAVHETVELTKRTGRPHWTGFANGVLRGVNRLLTDEHSTAPSPPTALPRWGEGGELSAPGPRVIPLRDGGFRLLIESVLPDPTSDPAGYFAAAFSFPEWIARRWCERFDRDELWRLGFWLNSPGRLCLRTNLLRATREELLDALVAAGVSARPGDVPEAIWIDSPARVDLLPGFTEGWFSVQDESGMHAARLLAPRPGERVLDLCAAPGGKTTHLAALMHNEGSILAVDVRQDKLDRIRENCERLGVTIVRTHLSDTDEPSLSPGDFDAILLDVPCSNTGVLGKRPEARWRLRAKDIAELTSLQRRLLAFAVSRLALGGRLVYSTCSIELEENRQLVESVLTERPDLRLEREVHLVPGRPADGGYQALLVGQAFQPDIAERSDR